MKTLIIGEGEVGSALFDILSESYDCGIIDKDSMTDETFEIIHICFPYGEGFVGEVEKYQERFKPKYTVIHSTVPVGTSRKCNAIHSPVRGRHPKMEGGIRTFIKFLGGEQASEVADYFRRAGIEVYLTEKSETTELMKIASTTCYSKDIEWVKEVKRECDKYNVPFEAWTIWTSTYNEGYRRLGFPEYWRPNLTPIMTRIGGHCLMPNLEFWGGESAGFIKKLNKQK